ncbi:MAG: hypothetical protein CMM62_20425 [Rhodospirillaceae bacterium]|jgi:hypothetical protein|nr:hypothetical protein [Rhodospirillaceae bacterium]MAX62256.1 hypothetical protein [Rhodospirillaceae bacterium]MAX65158.1 hypothetical protein [Rhodospirillaceae bacterium]MBB59500.1 hypothetical protein [Rhodospirillaceae bacterium]|tara:strand:- start:540 stop:1340 length:801 start_codon:yes stop_codon:yes gene_type:complete
MTIAPKPQWHVLFDKLCMDKGYIDNVKLSSVLCDLRKSQASGAFDTTLKSLGNWRQGKHTPSRRNFRLLTIALEIEDQSAQAEEWKLLYEDALCRKPASDVDESVGFSPGDRHGQETDTKGRRFSKPLHRYAAMAGVVAVLAVGALLVTEPEAISGNDTRGITTLPVDMTDQQIYYREIANLRVGESIVLHGKRGPSCGEQPLEWPDVLKYLPELNTGVWSDGGVGFRVSRACGGPTPARAVVFTATRTGMDRFMLYDDPITITVE